MHTRYRCRFLPSNWRRRLDVRAPPPPLHLCVLVLWPLSIGVSGWRMHTLQQGEPLAESRVLQALCNAVISASVEKGEDKDALKLLADLLAQDAVDPNAGDEASWDIVRRPY